MPHKDRNALAAEIQEDVRREEMAAVFQAAMAGHLRAHVPGTNINEQTLLASDYLDHFHDLATRFERLSTEKTGITEEFIRWRPMGYEEHFAQSNSGDKDLAIAAYRRAPAEIRERFDDAAARLQAEALRLISRVGKAVNGPADFAKTCSDAAARLSVSIGEAEAIANGQRPAGRDEAQDGREAARIAV